MLGGIVLKYLLVCVLCCIVSVVVPARAEVDPFWVGNSWAIGRDRLSDEQGVGGGVSCSIYAKGSFYSAMTGIKDQPPIITLFMGTMQTTSLSFASPVAPKDDANSLTFRILTQDFTTTDFSSDLVVLPVPKRGGYTYIWVMPNEEGRRLAHILSGALTVTIRNADQAVVQTITVNDEGRTAFEKITDCLSG